MPSESISKPTRQQIHDSFEDLYQGLSAAYWAASTIEDKDRIHGVAELVFEILTALNKEDIESRTEQFKALQKSFTDANERLDKLKQEIDQILQSVKIAADVTAAIDKTLGLGAKYFA